LRNDTAPESVYAEDVVNAVSFLSDVPLGLSKPPFDDRFVPENDADRQTLELLGTDEVYLMTTAILSTRAFSNIPFTSELVRTLVARRPGLRLYADALRLDSDVAKFRELWRILESAFGVQDDELVAALTDYPPAQAMGFTAKKLRELLVLRNRASHAASKRGLEQLAAVKRECSQRLPKLKNLAERVIITKKSWGFKTKGVEELLPLGRYYLPD
jgi:hypothetical protein